VAGTPLAYAVLLHLTHYDPRWCKDKADEQRFDRALMEELIDLTAASGFNTVVIDIADAVEYATHPDLKRPYTVPMRELADLAERARGHGLEVVGKLNFAKSERDRHNWWFRPYRDLPDDDAYFQHAWQVIDEVLEAVGPGRYFHIGMDEDRIRPAENYCAAIERLHVGLTERGRRVLMWSDACHQWDEQRDAALAAAWERLPRDIVLIPWAYRQAMPDVLRMHVEQGFEVWAGSARDIEVARAWADAVRVEGGAGLIATCWQPTQPEQADTWRRVITESAKAYGIAK